MLKYLFVLVLSILSISGCAPNSSRELKTGYAQHYQFETDKNYQQVYRTIKNKATDCYAESGIGGQIVVQGDLYADIKKGEVVVALHGGFGIDTHLAVDLAASENETTLVDVYNALSTWNDMADAVKKWVVDDYKECK